jgi:hypothetical protein
MLNPLHRFLVYVNSLPISCILSELGIKIDLRTVRFYQNKDFGYQILALPKKIGVRAFEDIHQSNRAINSIPYLMPSVKILKKESVFVVTKFRRFTVGRGFVQ